MDLVEQAGALSPNLWLGTPFVYLLRLKSGSFYVGCSTDYETRFREHEHGTACRTTRIDPAIAVAWIEIHNDFSSARRREAQIKKWSRAKKEALIAGQGDRLRRYAKSKN